jgi:hypothetical protein
MQINGERLIRLPREDSKENYLAGFWRWVEILTAADYHHAVEALYWAKAPTWTPAALEKAVTKSFGGKEPWSVVIPNARLVGVINDAVEYDAGRNQGGGGWFMAQIPLTTAPSDPKSDQIPLMGLAASFFVRPHAGAYILELEIFHA